MTRTARPAGPLTPTGIRALRERLGLTVEQAAARIRLSRRTWYAWEDGTRRPGTLAAAVLRDWLEGRG